ncbi:MAG: tetratricopeptide repeat protein [Verrucomicrobia bacterium]|nr:tetratricopeptide repeat protein [Verrucomicrobiota bacterium]
MKKIYCFPLPLLVTLLIALTFSGCSRESKKARYLEQADRAFASDKYDLAEIDYKNTLKIDNLNPRAIGRLALIYADQGRIGQAIPFVLKGRELQPDNLELRLKFAQLNLATGNLKDARAEAYAILERHPTNPDAPVLLTGTIARPQDIAEVRTRLEGLPAPTSSGAPVLTALAMIELLQGHIKEGEALLQKALAADPKFAAAHSALGTLYGLQNDKIKALQSFKLAAEESPARSPRRLQYAQFLITSGDANAGTKYLEEITRATPDFLSAWTMLAEFALMDKQYKTCASYIDKIVARDGQNLEALFIRGRLQLAQGNTTKGVEEFARLANIYPRAP